MCPYFGTGDYKRSAWVPQECWSREVVAAYLRVPAEVRGCELDGA